MVSLRLEAVKRNMQLGFFKLLQELFHVFCFLENLSIVKVFAENS